MRSFPVGLVAVLVACGGGGGGGSTEPPPSATGLTIQVAAAALVPGQVTQVTVIVTENGVVVAPTGVSYESSAPNVASVGGDGRVSAVATGNARITASRGTASAGTNVSVQPGGMLTPAGGTITAASAGIVITVPAGAVQSDIPLAIAPTTTPWVDPTIVRGAAYQIGSESLTFLHPISVRIGYDISRAPYGLPHAALGLRRAESINVWSDLRPSVVDSAAQTVTAMLTRGGLVSVGRLAAMDPCTSTAHRAFDFWLGTWSMTSGGQNVGTNTITLEPGGCAVYENYVSPTPLSPGRSVSFYRADTDRWYQTYIDAGNNMVLLGTTSFSDRSMVMTSTTQGQGTAWSRTSWSLNTDGSVRQLIETTFNSGQTYSVQFDIIYRKP